jgi:hypothetical protein
MVMKKHPATSMRKTKMTTSDLPFTELLFFLFWCLDAKGREEYLVRLVPVVVWLYLTLVHAMSAFSLSLAHQRSSSRLQHSSYNPSASAFSFPVSTTIPNLTILEFIFWTIKLRKQLYKKLKYDT